MDICILWIWMKRFKNTKGCSTFTRKHFTKCLFFQVHLYGWHSMDMGALLISECIDLSVWWSIYKVAYDLSTLKKQNSVHVVACTPQAHHILLAISYPYQYAICFNVVHYLVCFLTEITKQKPNCSVYLAKRTFCLAVPLKTQELKKNIWMGILGST